MFLFFCTICFAAEPTINGMNELNQITENLGITERQVRQITHGYSYDSRKLPGFKEAFQQELKSNDITSKQAEAFMGAAEFLLVAYVRKNKTFIPKQDIDATHPLAEFYTELKATILSKIKE